MTQEEPKEDKAFDSIEQLSKIAQDLVRRKTELAQRTWQGLTDEEVSEVFGGDIHAEHSGELRFVRAIEAKLKQKNGYAEEENT